MECGCAVGALRQRNVRKSRGGTNLIRQLKLGKKRFKTCSSLRCYSLKAYHSLFAELGARTASALGKLLLALFRRH